MSEQKTCKSCGKQISEDFKFCPNCGTKTNNEIFLEENWFTDMLNIVTGICLGFIINDWIDLLRK